MRPLLAALLVACGPPGPRCVRRPLGGFLRRATLILAVVLALPVSAAEVAWVVIRGGASVTSLDPGKCVRLTFDDSNSSSDNSAHLASWGQTLDIEFEPDNTGTNTLATVDLYSCTRTDGDQDGTNDTHSCVPLKWDTDGDGVVDNAELDGSTDMKRSVYGIQVPGWLFVDITAVPGSGDEAELNVCSRLVEE